MPNGKKSKVSRQGYDVLIVGGGPAGLSAALILGRCCRSVAICDDGQPRNARSKALHGYLGVGEIAPKRFLQLAKRQLKPYRIHWIAQTVAKIATTRAGYVGMLPSGRKIRARKVLLATGIRDILPEIEGIESYYGKSVFVCPYCDGWEFRGRAIGVYGRGQRGINLSLTMRGWSRDVTLFTGGSSRISKLDRAKLEQNGVQYVPQKILALRGSGERLRSLVLEGGRSMVCRALFLNTATCQHSPLFQQVRGHLDGRKGIATRRYQLVKRPGIYAAGNALRDVQLSIVAAAEGAAAAFEINCALLREDRKTRCST